MCLTGAPSDWGQSRSSLGRSPICLWQPWPYPPWPYPSVPAAASPTLPRTVTVTEMLLEVRPTGWSQDAPLWPCVRLLDGGWGSSLCPRASALETPGWALGHGWGNRVLR